MTWNLYSAQEWLEAWYAMTCCLHCTTSQQSETTAPTPTPGRSCSQLCCYVRVIACVTFTTWDCSNSGNTHHCNTTEAPCLISHNSHGFVRADLRFCLIGDGGMQHGLQHCRTVRPILLLNHVNASCVSAHMQRFILWTAEVKAVANWVQKQPSNTLASLAASTCICAEYMCVPGMFSC